MKSVGRSHRERPWGVAPHWGAWIEITGIRRTIGVTAVAPHWGAWIEIPCMTGALLRAWSHPTGVRGLKCILRDPQTVPVAVAPHWGAWIEIITCDKPRG